MCAKSLYCSCWLNWITQNELDSVGEANQIPQSMPGYQEEASLIRSRTALLRLNHNQAHVNIMDNITAKVDEGVGVVWRVHLNLPVMTSNVKCHPREVVMPSNKCHIVYSKPIDCLVCDHRIQIGAHIVINMDSTIGVSRLFIAQIPLLNNELMICTGARAHRDKTCGPQTFYIQLNIRFQNKTYNSHWTTIT